MKKHTTTNTVRAKKTTTTKRYPFTTAKTFAVGSREGQIFAQVPYTVQDFKNSLLIVSLSINIFLLALWLTTQVSDAYAMSVARLIVN